MGLAVLPQLWYLSNCLFFCISTTLVSLAIQICPICSFLVQKDRVRGVPCTSYWGGSICGGSLILLPRRIANIASTQGRIPYITCKQDQRQYCFHAGGEAGTILLLCRGGSGEEWLWAIAQAGARQSKFYLTPILPTSPHDTCTLANISCNLN